MRLPHIVGFYHSLLSDAVDRVVLKVQQLDWCSFHKLGRQWIKQRASTLIRLFCLLLPELRYRGKPALTEDVKNPENPPQLPPLPPPSLSASLCLTC